MDYNKLTLENVGNGAAVELFEEELRKVLSNIADSNTSATAKREITLKIGWNQDRLYRQAGRGRTV